MRYKITQIQIFHRSIGIGIEVNDTALESTWYRIEKKMIGNAQSLPPRQVR